MLGVRELLLSVAVEESQRLPQEQNPKYLLGRGSDNWPDPYIHEKKAYESFCHRIRTHLFDKLRVPGINKTMQILNEEAQMENSYVADDEMYLGPTSMHDRTGLAFDSGANNIYIDDHSESEWIDEGSVSTSFAMRRSPDSSSASRSLWDATYDDSYNEETYQLQGFMPQSNPAMYNPPDHLLWSPLETSIDLSLGPGYMINVTNSANSQALESAHGITHAHSTPNINTSRGQFLNV